MLLVPEELWENVTWNGAKVKPAMNGTWRVPEAGFLNFEHIVLEQSPGAVHNLNFKIDLFHNQDRSLMQAILTRMEVERGVTLKELKINGRGYDADLLKEGIPPKGNLECRYQVKNQRYEASYFLDLSNQKDRALAIRLRERAVHEPGENWVNERLNGVPFSHDEHDEEWKMPMSGILELDYKTTRPSQMVLQHCDLKLDDKWDYAIAEAFLERAFLEEGTNIYNSTIDNIHFEITETVMNLRCLPHRGLWSFDYVSMVDAAARAVSKHITTEFSLDLSLDEEFAKAQEMRFRAMTETDVHMTDCALDGKAFVFRKCGAWKVPPGGIFTFNMLAVDIAEDRVSAEQFERLSSALLKIRHPVERLQQLSDLMQNQRISCHQAMKLMRVFNTQKEVQDAIVTVYPRLVDPFRLQMLLTSCLPDEASITITRQKLEQISAT